MLWGLLPEFISQPEDQIPVSAVACVTAVAAVSAVTAVSNVSAVAAVRAAACVPESRSC